LIEKTITVAGANIAYQVHGPDGAPVLLLGHGLLFDHRMWAPLIPELAQRYRLLVVEVRGHGSSKLSETSAFTLEDLAADWRAILDAEGVARVTLVGLSMGGMTALRFALAWPERVEALALLDTSAQPEPLWKVLKYRSLVTVWQRVGSNRLIAALVGQVLFGRTTRRNQPGLVGKELGQIFGKRAEDLAPAIQSVIGRGDLSQRLDTIMRPTLVIVGDEDAACPPKCSRLIAERILGAKLVELPRCGHMSTLESPAAVLAALDPFLTAHARSVS